MSSFKAVLSATLSLSLSLSLPLQAHTHLLLRLTIVHKRVRPQLRVLEPDGNLHAALGTVVDGWVESGLASTVDWGMDVDVEST